MTEFESSNFNNIIQQIIKKSLFTERQIEIILNRRDLIKINFNISKGAYFRQVTQSKKKLMSFYYTLILLRGLGVLSQDDIDVMSKLSNQIVVIKNGDVFPENEERITNVIEQVIQQSSIM